MNTKEYVKGPDCISKPDKQDPKAGSKGRCSENQRQDGTYYSQSRSQSSSLDHKTTYHTITDPTGSLDDVSESDQDQNSDSQSCQITKEMIMLPVLMDLTTINTTALLLNLPKLLIK